MSSSDSDRRNESPIDRGHRKAIEWLRGDPKRLLIDGKWVGALSGRTFESIDPATERQLALIAEADRADVDLAVAAARSAFSAKTWSGISPHVRARYLLKIGTAIEQNAEELAVLESLDMGAPVAITPARVAAAAELFYYYAGWVTKIQGTTNPTDASRFIYVLREAMGVCALINAWNVPILMAATKLAPALACGNTAVLKPAEQAPLTTLRLAELIQEIDLPPGVINVVQGFGPTAGAAMAEHPDVDKIAFTGSTGVGRQILHASTVNMKKVTLELGGKSPNIVFPDADLDKAISMAVLAFCRNSGQICSAGTRLLVHESIHDEVTGRVAKIAATYKVGSPLASDTQLGPLVSAKQMNTVLSYVQAGKEEGARLVTGGTRIKPVGYFVAPTVFSNASERMRIVKEEIFGPVLSIVPFKDEEDAILRANSTEYGLAAAVWTRDVSRAHRMARALKSGRVWINTYAETDPVMSIGGYKQSGYGREMGPEAIDAYSQTKAVLMRL
jgi:acyl-CoA reductase-like NAD-dependent aldehyde dehydrogenase